ncbi:MAG: right-handed parallel beta-helix repeat-containing protein [Phycisphaerae bacterium]|nr:right-handed parallel beta-helix repeat-containing protein [Phycisphaerae bacterium]
MAGVNQFIALSCAFALLCGATALATDRHVPGTYATIQAAINACVAGDTVIIADGTYTGTGNKNLDFHGLAITVRSASGAPATCIIDSGNSGRGFYFHSGESAAALVQGLTIRNGNVVYPGGGGVYCISAHPTLSNCVITGNTAQFFAGGLHCEHASPTLLDCTISGNAGTGGGGVSCEASSNASLTNCLIVGNTSINNLGGGISSVDSSPTFTHCWIANNTAGNGGGVYSANSGVIFTGCIITRNTGTNNGGGIYCAAAGTALRNCTIVGNIAGTAGGGLYCQSSSPVVTNCILWANTPQQFDGYLGSPVVTHCDVQGGWSGDGNIDADPLFRDPDGPDNDPSTIADNDYRLTFASPCLDAGDNGVVPAGSLDLDGHPRIARFVVDMGAYEIPFGDLDCSGTIGFGDINPFVLALSNPPAYAQMYPDCPPLHGDMDADGEVGFGDINPFVAALTGGK